MLFTAGDAGFNRAYFLGVLCVSAVKIDIQGDSSVTPACDPAH
jgi:hypothetical protein